MTMINWFETNKDGRTKEVPYATNEESKENELACPDLRSSAEFTQKESLTPSEDFVSFQTAINDVWTQLQKR